MTEVVNVKEKKTEIDTIKALHHIHATEVEVVIMIETNFLTEEVPMNKIQVNPFEIFTTKAWQTLLLSKPNNKKSLLLKSLFEDLQSGNYSRDKKKKAKGTTPDQTTILTMTQAQ